jgi:hypothetical protein
MLLMSEGPHAAEFNMDRSGKPNFGNWFTSLEFNLINLYMFLQDGMFRYLCLYFGISVLGFFSDELFYSLHLLDVTVRFPSLSDVVQAVAVNRSKLASLGMLALVIIYIYATISFFYMQDTFNDYAVNAFDSDWVGENMCESLF